MTEKEKMYSGMLYYNLDKNLQQLMLTARKFYLAYNSLSPDCFNEKEELLKKHLGGCGNTITIEQPFFCDYGCNLYVGEDFYANVGFTAQDSGEIHIGNNCFIGPHVSIFTAHHPFDLKQRNAHYEYAFPVNIGDNVWIGGGCIINPGITIGNNVVIGSGSVVTKDIPDNCIAVGVPCRVIKSL